VLLGSALADMSGSEVARRIGIRCPLTPTPRLILQTARSSDDSLLRAEDLGVDALLVRPLEPCRLFDAIREVVFSPSLTAPIQREDSLVADAHAVRAPHVLVAEDNESNQNLVREILASAGMRCDMVSNGDDAVRLALEQPERYAIILTDLEMPGMDGLEAVREIRRRASRQVPIIVLSAHAMAQDRQRCLEAGVNQYLTKPVNPARLIQEIKRWLVVDPVPQLTPDNFDAETLHTLMGDLDALLANNSIAAEKLALRLLRELAGRGLDAQLGDLEQAIDRLDYPAARTILAALARNAVFSDG